MGQDVPGYLTYYLGGANTIRGYGVEDLGAKLSGKNQLLATAEHNVNLLPLARRDIFKWAFSLGLQLALFTDLGIAWNEGAEFVRAAFPGGAGAGVRFLVPGAEQVRSTSAGAAPGGSTSISRAGPSPRPSVRGYGEGASSGLTDAVAVSTEKSKLATR